MKSLAIRQRLHNPELRAVCPNEMGVFKNEINCDNSSTGVVDFGDKISAKASRRRDKKVKVA